MNTNRVYDISTRAMLFAVSLAIITIVGAIYSPSFTMFPSEVIGWRLMAVFAIFLAGGIAYVWAFGRKTAEPISFR